MSYFAINSSTATNSSLFNQVLGSDNYPDTWQNTIFTTPAESINDMFMKMLFKSFSSKKTNINNSKSGENFQRFDVNPNLAELKGVYNPKLSARLANTAYSTANTRNTVGMCYRGVKDALIRANLDDGSLSGRSAYQAYSQLKNDENFTEVKVGKNELKNLPAGCLIVWDASEGHPHGHITTTLGNGKEASDHIQNVIIRDAKYAVFVPTSTNAMA